jgi:hypothetical protein
MPNLDRPGAEPTHVATVRSDAAGSPHHGGQTSGDSAGEWSTLVPNEPGDAHPSDESRPARPSVPDVVTPAEPPWLNDAAAVTILRMLMRASQDQTDGPSIAST